MPSAEERKAERQRTILEAAVRAFSRQGYHECTVAQVAREAGIADGTIYLYFQGKEDLLVNAFRQVLEGILVRLDTELAGTADPLERLRRIVSVHFAVMEEDPELASFLQLQARQPDPAIRRAIAESLGAYARRIEVVLDQGKATGQLRADVGTRLMRRMIFGTVDETVSSWLLRPERDSLARRVEPVLDVVLRGIAGPHT